MPPAIISCGEYCEKHSTSEPLKAIHDAFVCAKNILALICVEEKLDSIWPKLDYVSSVIRISDLIRLNSHLLVVISRI